MTTTRWRTRLSRSGHRLCKRRWADKNGIERFGFHLPMDDASAQVAIDLSGRAFSKFEGTFDRESVGGLATEMVPHFFRSLADGLAANIHIRVEGENTHHRVESSFKAVGRSLRAAIAQSGGPGVPSTKGLAVSLMDAMSSLTVVDSGGANLSSVLFALERLGIEARSRATRTRSMPVPRSFCQGVGAAAAAMGTLRERELVSCLRELPQPVLGHLPGDADSFERPKKVRLIAWA